MFNKKRVWLFLNYLLLSVICFGVISPILWTILLSFTPSEEIFGKFSLLPSQPTLSHYQALFTKLEDFLNYYKNSLIVTLSTIAIIVAISTLAGYAFGRRKFRLKEILFYSLILIVTIPYVVYLIPIYIMADQFGFLSSYIGLILVYVALYAPFSIFIMSSVYRAIPDELEDAALIDGCNSFQVFFRVILPLGWHGLLSIIIFSFVMVWGEFLFALTIMRKSSMRTLPVGIVLLRGEGQSWAFGDLGAAITAAIIPAVVLFIILQKYFVAGLREGIGKM